MCLFSQLSTCHGVFEVEVEVELIVALFTEGEHNRSDSGKGGGGFDRRDYDFEIVCPLAKSDGHTQTL